MKFRKKPVIIEAVQWKGHMVNEEEVRAFVGKGRKMYVYGDNYEKMSIPTLEGRHEASIGDWIIRGVKGEIYPCKPDIFEMTYEPVEDKQTFYKRMNKRHKHIYTEKITGKLTERISEISNCPVKDKHKCMKYEIKKHK